MTTIRSNTFPLGGFTLVEMAIVLAILTLVLSSGLAVLTVQQDQQRIADTNALLNAANEALIGFALSYGRLPCPASAASNGVESPTGGACTNALNGFLPGVTLGLAGVDSNGYLTDAWKLSQNRIRYAVTTANANAATTTDGIKGITMSGFSPDLYLCASATGITATTCGTATTLSNNAVAVIYSLGKNAATGGTSSDEAANMNNDSVFVSHALATTNETGGEFDDQLVWLSRYTLFNRMIQAGKLP
jgi:prepilin-type N-terminal cleavage/methylation domain-containing protein